MSSPNVDHQMLLEEENEDMDPNADYYDPNDEANNSDQN